MGEVVDAEPGNTLKRDSASSYPLRSPVEAVFIATRNNIPPVTTVIPPTIRTLPRELMAGLFGYSHMTGGYSGGQAEYVRVPFSDVRPIVIPDGIDDDKVLFLSHILPTGWMAAENCDIEPGDTVVIIACRKGGRMSMPAVYGGFVDKFPLGAFMEKALTLKTGQTHVQRYMAPLLAAIMEDKIDTTFLISHRLPLESAPDGYRMFHDEQDHATKIVLKPGMN